MVRKNGSKNLFIKQGDNSNLDLFMQSPEFIKDFTNWEAKTSSLEVTRSRAFEKTPFDRNADEMTEYTSIEIGNNVALCADANYSTVRLGTAISGNGIYMVKTIKGFPENETYENPEKISKIETNIKAMLSEVEQDLIKLEENCSPSWESSMLPLEEIHLKIHNAWSPINHLHSVRNSDDLRAVWKTP